MPPRKKEKIPPPGNKKDEFTNFWTKAKWKQGFLKSALECNGRNLRPEGARIVGNALAKNKWVTHLDFSHNHLRDQGAIELAQILKTNDCLQIVNLSCNEITDVGAIAIASAFVPAANPTGLPSTWNRTVSQLILSGNLIRDDGVQALLQAAACHRDLARIDVQNNRVGSMGPRNMMRAMERNRFFAVLWAGNEVGDEGTEFICAAYRRFGGKGSHAALNLARNDVCKNGAEHLGLLLSNNDFLQDVNLSNNTLGAKGAEHLFAKILPPFTTVLRYLNLQNNCLGDEGAEEVAKAIDANIESLEKVNLSFNEISDKGGLHIARAMAKNTHIGALIMSYNSVRDQTADAFAEGIRTTKTLKFLDLKRNGFNEESKTKLSDAQKACQVQGFRLDYGAMDDAVPVDDFKNKLREFAEQLKAKASEKKPKKSIA